MTTKLYDLAVKTGEYTNRDGETKGDWKTVGACLESDEGNKFILLERWFNPAGLPNPAQHGTVIVSMFKPRDKKQENTTQQEPQDGKEPPF